MATIKSYTDLQHQFIKKACEWLKENADMYETFDSESKSYYMDKDKLVEDFKEYMKGE